MFKRGRFSNFWCKTALLALAIRSTKIRYKELCWLKTAPRLVPAIDSVLKKNGGCYGICQQNTSRCSICPNPIKLHHPINLRGEAFAAQKNIDVDTKRTAGKNTAFDILDVLSEALRTISGKTESSRNCYWKILSCEVSYLLSHTFIV